MDPMEQAVAHHRAGRLKQAAAGYTAVLREDPERADALHLLGLVAYRLGHPDDALDLMDRALALDEGMAAAHANRALVLRALGRLDDGIEALRHALRLRSGFGAAQVNLARFLVQAGDLEGAEDAVRRAAGHPEAPRVLADVLLAAGRVDEAEATWAELPPPDRDATGACLLGRQLLGAGRPRDALRRLTEAVRLDPDLHRAWIAWVDALSQIPDPPVLEPELRACLARDGIDHQRAERAIRAALPEPGDHAALLAHPLFVPWLTRTLVAHPDWEVALTRLRRALLERAVAGEELPVGAMEALAVQGFYTEYAWWVEPDERALLDRLPAGHLARAMYGSPPASWADRDDVPTLVRVAIEEPAAEARLAPTLPTLGDTSDPVSAEVGAMYEDNPYPRLVAVHLKEPEPLAALLARLNPTLEDLPRGPLEVLIAGGGTGQHPLTTATTLADVKVLSVDLSRRSGARAARRALELGIDNVDFAQGDLLALGDLGRRFDVVEAVGVLHHLAEPLAGWRVLRDCTRPGGWMRIGLYAERGRGDVVAARALLEAEGFEATPEGIRAARRRLMGLPEGHPARPVVYSPDFPSLTGVRDLLFHPQEHRFTLPAIAEALDALDLELAALQHPRADAGALYDAAFPSDRARVDLARWEAVEAEHPRLFSGMILLWCRTRGAPA